MSRQSKRTPAPTAKAVEAGIQLRRAQAAAEKPSLPGFTVLAEQRQREKEAAEAENEAKVAAEKEEEDVVEVGAPAAATAKKSRRARKSKKWNTCYDLMLAQMGEFSRLRWAENSCVLPLQKEARGIGACSRCCPSHKPFCELATSPLQRQSARVDFMLTYWFGLGLERKTQHAVRERARS